MPDHALRYARIALGVAFLSAVASRFGLWGGGSWDRFEAYCAEVNSFMPAWSIPILARVATACELTFGVLLVAGIATRWAALGAAVLLLGFGTAMAISFGIKEPLDYSVFTASACALLVSRFDGARELLELAHNRQPMPRGQDRGAPAAYGR